MGIIYNFESSKNRIELSKLEKNNAVEPFSKDSSFNFYFNEVEISAMNFIYDFKDKYDLGFLPIKGDNLSTWNVGYFSK